MSKVILFKAEIEETNVIIFPEMTFAIKNTTLLLATAILACHKIKHVITIIIGLIAAGNLSKSAV